jgi:hypothetical protein
MDGIAACSINASHKEKNQPIIYRRAANENRAKNFQESHHRYSFFVSTPPTARGRKNVFPHTSGHDGSFSMPGSMPGPYVRLDVWLNVRDVRQNCTTCAKAALQASGGEDLLQILAGIFHV